MPPVRSARSLAAAVATAAVALAGVAALPAGADTGAQHFNRVATFPAYLNTDVSTETVAEISTVTADGATVIYTDAAGGGLGFVDITDPGNPQPAGYLPLGDPSAETHVEPTSVYATQEYLLAVVDTSESFSGPSGRLVVFDITNPAPVADWTPLKVVELGGQPDSVAVSDDGETVVIAIENQRDEDLAPAGGDEGDLPQPPAGYLAVVDLHRAAAAWRARAIDLTGLTGLDTPEDPEPEYVSISPDNRHVAVTLQENNGVAIVDLRTTKVRNHFSAGLATVTDIDTVEDGTLDFTGTITDVPREPDSIGWIGDRYVATANEGDWKGGTRGWTIFDATNGQIVFDSGNAFDHLTAALGQYPEDRSENKGSEPEGLATAVFGGVPYVFVASERANILAVYDVTDPAQPILTQTLPSTAGPEGVLSIPSRDLLVVSAEEDSADDLIRAAVQVYQRSSAAPAFPTLVSAYVDGTPIGWGALSALSADPANADRLYTAWDSYYSPSTILTIDTSTTPATIVGTLPVIKEGTPAAHDVEGLWAKPDGGFWLGVEGATGDANLLVEVDTTGTVLREVHLPAAVTDALGKQGIEGVTGYGTGDAQVLYFVLQRHIAGLDPDDTARIGRYEVATGDFGWFGYPLETTSTDGDWIGLSEVTAVDENTLAVIERDKLGGPDAVLKAIYTVDIPAVLAASDEDLPVAQKSLAHDVLPDLAALHGWVQEKLEGLTIGGDGHVYVVVDNDGVEDANGENVFLDLGPATSIVGD